MTAGDDDVYLAPAALVALLLHPFAPDPPAPATPAPLEATMINLVHTADVPDAFLAALIDDCGPAGLDCEPEALLGCWLSESGLSPRAQNKGALAAGFFQAMPATLRRLNFRGDVKYQERPGAYEATELALKGARSTHNATAIAVVESELRILDHALSDAFTRLTLVDQLTWAYRYYRPHAGRLVNGGACYAANFVPAWIGHADEPAWIICAKDGRSDAGPGNMPAAESEEWFTQNEQLDVDKDGAITMGDLAAKAALAAASPRGLELAARIAALRAGDERPPETQPEPAT